MTSSLDRIDRTATAPTGEELENYRRDGFVVVRGLIPQHVLDAAETGMQRFYAGDRDHPSPGRTAYDSWGWTPDKGDVLRKNDYASLMVDDLATLVRYPGIGAYAAALAGAASIRLWHDQLLYKPPGVDGGVTNVGWHTDRQYWLGCTSAQMLTAWVPFHDCDASMGGVTFMAGSHLWPPAEGLDFFDGDLDAQEARMRAAGLEVRAVVPDLRRGDVTFHHCRTVHGSGANRSDRPRRSMAIHLQPGDNSRAVDQGPHTYHCNDELARTVDGRPDYSDPRICPQLFPAA